MSNHVINPLSVSNTQASLYDLQSQNQPLAAGIDFEHLLTTMLLNQLDNPLGGQSAGTDGFSSILSLLMGSFGGSLGGLGLLDGFNASLTNIEQARTIQINQFDAEKQIGGDGINSNCGPASLVMALRGLGMPIPGESAISKTGEVIELARKAMVNDNSRDGISSSGGRSESELNYFTDFDDLKRGASAAGANAHMIGENSSSILSALASGARVVVSGTFTGKSDLPWTGDRGTDNHSAPGNATQHIITVSGYNQATSKFIVNDPARRSPIEVTAAQLEHFMDGNAGALAIRRG